MSAINIAFTFTSTLTAAAREAEPAAAVTLRLITFSTRGRHHWSLSHRPHTRTLWTAGLPRQWPQLSSEGGLILPPREFQLLRTLMKRMSKNNNRNTFQRPKSAYNHDLLQAGTTTVSLMCTTMPLQQFLQLRRTLHKATNKRKLRRSSVTVVWMRTAR